jgi:hypothetical protein
VLLVRFSNLMVLGLLAATIPAFIAEAKFSGAAFRLRNWRSPDTRRLLYLEYVLANDEHAKEVKLLRPGAAAARPLSQPVRALLRRRPAAGRAPRGLGLWPVAGQHGRVLRLLRPHRGHHRARPALAWAT